jgi:hypothetical protein
MRFLSTHTRFIAALAGLAILAGYHGKTAASERPRNTLDTLAHQLLKKETLKGDKLRAIMDAGRQQACTHEIAMRVYQLS